MEEIWKDIKGYENYQISNLGNLKNKKNQRILKLRPSHKGYLKTNIRKNGKTFTVFMHRLVAETFLDKSNFKYSPDENLDEINLDKLEVNHKDENKINNCVNNLEWCTSLYNHTYNNLHIKRGLKTRKKIDQYDLNDNYLKTFNSLTEACNFVNGHTGHISNCCQGKRKTAYGYKWEYCK